MPKSNAPYSWPEPILNLCRLVFAPDSAELSPASAQLSTKLCSLTRAEWDELTALADTNHVLVRGFQKALRIFQAAGDTERAQWASEALNVETARIQNAIPFLHSICAAFQQNGWDATVIKSLDHLPDLGSDLDLYTSTAPEKVIAMMQQTFAATLAPRSWGDRLACKWNFLIPGLPEAVEIHMGRLGQTGEQTQLAASIPARARLLTVDGRTFRVSSIPDRLLISTLQRMYRHFYFRLCDMVDTAKIADAGSIDYERLRQVAIASGIWPGVATYLRIVSDTVRHFRGTGIMLPEFVTEAAQFGGEQIYFSRDFLRVPILPQSARLYGVQLSGLLRKGELQNGARLSLLPWLATAAAMGQKITGSDKGIW